MTRIRFAYSKPSTTGRDAAVTATLKLALLHRETVNGRIRTTTHQEVKLVPTEVFEVDEVTGATVSHWAGVGIADLSPTGADQGWEIEELAPIPQRRAPWVVAVPISALVVDATDLIELDRSSLQPTTESMAGYQALIAQVATAIASTGANVVAAEEAEAGAGTHAFHAGQSAAIALGHANAAAQAKLDAQAAAREVGAPKVVFAPDTLNPDLLIVSFPDFMVDPEDEDLLVLPIGD